MPWTDAEVSEFIEYLSNLEGAISDLLAHRRTLGGSSHREPRYDVDTMIATLDREAVRIVTAIPCVTAAKQLLDYQGDRSLSLQTVKFVTSAVQGSSLREHRDLASKQWEIRGPISILWKHHQPT